MSNSSVAWTHFVKLDKNSAKCKLCLRKYDCKGSSTSGLLKHLRTKHRNEITESNINKTFKGTPDENVNIAEKHLEQTLLKQPSITSSLAKHQTLADHVSVKNKSNKHIFL